MIISPSSNTLASAISIIIREARMGDESKLEEIKDYFKFWSYKGWEWRIRNFENIVDDPIDDIKHKINGISIFGLKIRLPSWLMKGSGDPDK